MRDAVATNDSRLISAALGEYAALHLDADGYRQAVLKCVFMDIPLSVVDGLSERAEAALEVSQRLFAEICVGILSEERAIMMRVRVFLLPNLLPALVSCSQLFRRH